MDQPTPPPRKATWRMGQRQRERLQWGVVSVICILLFMALRPYYFFIVETRDFQTCQSNVLKISSSIRRYAEDYEGTMPLGNQWMDTTNGYLAATSGTGFKSTDSYHCPRDKSGQETSYSFNDALSGMSLEVRSKNPEIETRRLQLGHPDRAPALLEHPGGRNSVVNVFKWDDVSTNLTRLHFESNHTGSTMLGSGKVSSSSDETLPNHKGKF